MFSDGLRKACRERLLSSLADLTGHTTVIKTGKFPHCTIQCLSAYLHGTDDKTAKIAAVASDSQFWISRVLSTVDALEKDTKHVAPLSEVDEEEQAVREKARGLIERLRKVFLNALISGGRETNGLARQVTGEQQDAAKGAELLLSATLLHQYCVDDGEEDGAEALEVRDFSDRPDTLRVPETAHGNRAALTARRACSPRKRRSRRSRASRPALTLTHQSPWTCSWTPSSASWSRRRRTCGPWRIRSSRC